MTLDDWSDAEIESMLEVGGNSSANSIYEAYIPKGYLKPCPDSSHEDRLNFIRCNVLCVSMCLLTVEGLLIKFYPLVINVGQSMRDKSS